MVTLDSSKVSTKVAQLVLVSYIVEILQFLKK